MSRYRLRGERGSLPLAMLAVIIIGSLAAVLTASVITGQQQTRFDQHFEQSLQVAETGLDQMIALVESRAKTADFTIPEDAGDWRQVDGGQYQGTAQRISSSRWVLTATGEGADGTTRQVQTTVEQDSLFMLAAAGRVGLTVNGANGADSYRSGTFTSLDPLTFVYNEGGSRFGHSDSGAECSANKMCQPTGKGAVATNGELSMQGQDFNNTDWVEIHYARERIPAEQILPGATGYCKNAATTCGNPNETECGLREPGSLKLQFCAEPIEMPDIELSQDPQESWDGNGETLEAGEHFYTNMTLYSNTVIEGTPENPTIIYLTGTLNIPNHQRVNFETRNGELVPRPPASLQIYSVSEGVAMDFKTHVWLSAAIYAPNGAFGGGSQGQIFGSVVANRFSTTGGWHFHWDESLADVLTLSPLVAADWVEL